MLSKLRMPLCVLFLVLAGRATAAQNSFADVYTAIRNNDLKELQSLVAGKKAGIADERGRTPLMYAAGAGSIEAMKILLDAGADPNTADSFGATPLMFGIRDIAKVRLLLDAGARVNDKSKQDQTALIVAAANPGSLETIRLLTAKGASAKAVGAAGRTGLIVAAETNDPATVEFFLNQGLDVNAVDRVDRSGHTALMAAAGQNNTAIVKALLQKGADANMATSEAAVVKNGPLAFKGRTALMSATPYGSPELIRALLDAHANVNARDVAGLTPLMFSVASENQDPNVVRMLLAAGADMNAKSTTGETVLDWARKYGSPEVLKLLGGGTVQPSSSTTKAVSFTMPPAGQLRSLLQTSFALLQRSSTQVAVNGGCVNCHHQNFTGIAVGAAREKAIPIDETAASEQRQAMIVALRGRDNTFVQRTDCCGSLDSTLYTLAALHADKYVADATTDAALAYLMSRQFSDGHWPREEASRSPLQDGDFNRIALAVTLMQAYSSRAMKAESDEHIARARRWLMTAKPVTTDDRASLLIGLKNSEAPKANVQDAAKSLLELQRPDGGWGGNPNLASDAYATSEALSALYESGMVAAGDAAYQRGMRFLLETRESDGSWHVRSRAPKFQPYFESGFPHDHDQWISAAATARAVVALARAIP
jgi:ankyrin repeat protein